MCISQSVAKLAGFYRVFLYTCSLVEQNDESEQVFSGLIAFVFTLEVFPLRWNAEPTALISLPFLSEKHFNLETMAVHTIQAAISLYV